MSTPDTSNCALHRSSRHPSGVLHVPMLLLLLALVTAGFGVWGLLRHWRHLVELQLRLDQCVGSSSMEMKRTLTRVGQLNDRMQTLRAALLVPLHPAQQALLRALLETSYLEQEWEEGRWLWRRVSWRVRRGCDNGGDLPKLYPAYPWRRDPPDSLGHRPLVWNDADVSEFLQDGLVSGPALGALVFGGNVSGQHEQNKNIQTARSQVIPTSNFTLPPIIPANAGIQIVWL